MLQSWALLSKKCLPMVLGCANFPMRSDLWGCLLSHFSVNLWEVELSCLRCADDLQLFILYYADLGSVVPLLSEHSVSILNSQDAVIKLYASHQSLLVCGWSWDRAVLICCLGWAFHPCRADLLLGKCFERPGGRSAHNCTFSARITSCQTCQSVFWRLVLIMGVYTVFDFFGSLFISSISLGLCV